MKMKRFSLLIGMVLLVAIVAAATVWADRVPDAEIWAVDYEKNSLVSQMDPAGVGLLQTAPVVWVDPVTVNVKRGYTLTVSVMTSVENLYGAEFDLDFAPAVVSATEIITGDIFASGFAAQRFIGADIVEYAASRLSPTLGFTGTGTIVSTVFQALAPGASPLHLHDVILAEVEGVPISGVTTTDGEIVVLGWSDLKGTVELQGRSDIVGPGPDWDGAVITATNGYTYNTTVGNLDGTWSVAEVISGTYTVEVEMERYLDASKTGVVVGDDSTVTLSQVKLLGGDANDDDYINIQDLSLIGGAFGTVPGDTHWKDEANINDDGKVNILDLVLAGGNYHESSPVSWP